MENYELIANFQTFSFIYFPYKPSFWVIGISHYIKKRFNKNNEKNCCKHRDAIIFFCVLTTCHQKSNFVIAKSKAALCNVIIFRADLNSQ